MEIVYDLWFRREYENREDTELHICIYASVQDAHSVIARLRDKPGFRDYSDGFEMHPVKLGQTGWESGFVTTFGPPPKDSQAEAFDLPAWLEPKLPPRVMMFVTHPPAGSHV
jgi:homoserine kinase type II